MFERVQVIFTILLGSWSSGSKHIWIRFFKWYTIELSMTIYSKIIGHQSSQSKIIKVAWLLSPKITVLEWGPGFIPCLGEFWRLVNLHSFRLQGSIVPYLKDVIHICLETESQGHDMTFNMIYLHSKCPYFIPYRGSLY